MDKNTLKIFVTIVCLIVGFSLMFGLSYEPTTLAETPVVDLPMSIIEANKLDPNTVIKPGRSWYENYWILLVCMIPIISIWIWPTQNRSKDSKIVRRSRML